MTRKLLVLGATSTIMQAILRACAKRDDQILLAARDVEETGMVAKDIAARTGSTCSVKRFDTNEFSNHDTFGAEVLSELGTPDIVLVATGALGDQDVVRDNAELSAAVVSSNFTGILTGLSQIIPAMEATGKGRIIVLSSVAGDRGRESNYVYGAAKAGVNAYLSGLRGRFKSLPDLRVSTVKLGFVATAMIATKSDSFLVARPDVVAKRITKLIDKPRDIIYFPRFWWGIMTIIKFIPEFIFKRLGL